MSQQLDAKLQKLSPQALELWKLRHTAEHVLHQAVKELFPKIHLAMGPATDEGFYFDFDPQDVKISETDFPKIEQRMREIINKNLPLIRQEVSQSEAHKLFKDNPYKLEWLDLIKDRNEKVTIYWTGEPNKPGSMVDLCAGPHVDSTGKIKAFKLLSTAGAYWHGDEKNRMLTRVYGTAFASKEELDKYLWQQAEAKKRDHRKLGQQLELFVLRDEVGPGLPLWLPKGNIIREELENWAKETEKKWGYQRVATPHITKSQLYYTSGHLPYYQKDMFPPMKLDGEEEYYLKPMNCPHHHMIFGALPRSYKELPLRLAEYGMCYRYEASGELFGLMRVRSLNINDAHIYCTQDQAVEEFAQVMRLHEHYYQTLGITDYHLEMALRDPNKKDKYHGDEAMWALAEKLMRQAVSKVNITMVEEEGSAAFYGPKIDFIIHSSIGRQFAVSTNQIDLYMGNRFGLKYTDNQGQEQTPVIMHRAPLGSHERFIGFLIEHFGGAFPTWLSPVQVVIVPIAERHLAYSQKILKELNQSYIRVELMAEAESMQKKIRNAELQKIPYILVVGDREQEAGEINIRIRGEKIQQTLKIDEFISKITQEIASRSSSLSLHS